jgi:hypothetical protein
MNDNVIVALISASSSVAIAVTALLLNFRIFASIEKRFESLDHRLEIIEADLKQFYRMLADQDKRLSRLEGR